MSSFLEDYNNMEMQAVHFKYKGDEYELHGYWGIAILNENGNLAQIHEKGFKSKEEALNAKVFDNGTKSLKDIYMNITDVEFD